MDTESVRRPAVGVAEAPASAMFGSRRGDCVMIALFVVAGTAHMVGRWGMTSGWFGLGIADLLTMVALALFGGSAVEMVRRTTGAPGVVRIILDGAALLVAAQCVNVVRHWPGLELGQAGPSWLAVASHGAFAFGIALYAGGFYRLMSHARDIHEQLSREHERTLEAEDALRHAFGEIEERVRERTVSLESANRRLEAEIADRKKVELALQRRLEMEAFLAEISRRFIRATVESLDGEIVATLEALGMLVGADHVRAGLFRSEPFGLAAVYEWTAAGLPSWGEIFQASSLAPFPWMARELCEGRTVAVASLDDLPAAADIERAACGWLGLKSFVTMPILAAGRLQGFMSFDTMRSERTWAEADLRIAGIVGEILTNILLRMGADSALRESKDRYQGLVEGLSEAIFRVRLPSGEFEYASPAMARVFGHGIEEFTTISDMIPKLVEAGAAADSLERWERVRGGDGVPPLMEYRALAADGGERWIAQSNRVVRDDRGVAIALECIARDATEDKRLRRMIEEHRASVAEASKLSALGEMAANVAHEINNPLAVVSGAAEQVQVLVRQRYGEDEVLGKLTDALMRNVLRIQQINRGLRTLMHEGIDAPFRVVPLKHTIDETVALCQERFQAASVVLTLAAPPESLVIECHPTQVMQVLANLLANALHAAAESPGRWVAMAVAEDVDSVSIAVTDSGSGIPEDIRARIFDPFFTTKDPGKGSGLGLGIARKIAEAHGGALALDSQTPHTRFVFRLPRKQPAGRELAGLEAS